MRALAVATREAIQKAGISGEQVQALAVDTTGSSVIPVGNRPPAARRILPLVRPPRESRSRGNYRSRPPRKASGHRMVRRSLFLRVGLLETAALAAAQSRKTRRNSLPHSNIATWRPATLCGITDPRQVKRSICAMGHKWMWNADLGGLPLEDFLVKVDPLFAGVREKLQGEYVTSDHIAGKLSAVWAEKLGLKAGIPIPVGAFRRSLGRHRRGLPNRRHGERQSARPPASSASRRRSIWFPESAALCKGSVHPRRTGIEAGLSAVGDIFNAIAQRADTDVADVEPGPREISRRTNRSPARHLGQRRPDRARKSESARSHSRLESAKHRAG